MTRCEDSLIGFWTGTLDLDTLFAMELLLVYYMDVHKVWLYYILRVFLIPLLLSNCFIIWLTNSMSFGLIICEKRKVVRISLIPWMMNGVQWLCLKSLKCCLISISFDEDNSKLMWTLDAFGVNPNKAFPWTWHVVFKSYILQVFKLILCSPYIFISWYVHNCYSNK